MGLFLKIKNFWKNFHDQLWGRISKKGTGGLWEGDNTPIGGGYMPLYAPQMPQFWLVLYILYYTTATTMTSAEGKRKAFRTI
jgi:hypothetical protein